MNRQLLIREITGENSPTESARVRAWVAEDPGNGEILASLRETWVELGAVPPGGGYDIEHGWSRLRNKVAGHAPGRPQAPRLTIHHRALAPARSGFGGRAVAASRLEFRPLARISASLGAACAVGVFVGFVLRPTHRPPTRRDARVGVRLVTTANAQRASIELADGTRVLLGVHSTLRTPAHFGAPNRDVELDGEAYFDVHHDASHPFRVHAGGAVMQDLGTRFGVRAYASDATARVVVVEGKVAVQSSDSSVDPRPPSSVSVTRGQLAELEHGQVRALLSVDPASYLAWTGGRLVFEGTPLREAVAQLGRWYDLDIRLADPKLGERHVTGSFKDEPVTDVLQVIAGAVGLRYERRGSVVTFFTPAAR